MIVKDGKKFYEIKTQKFGKKAIRIKVRIKDKDKINELKKNMDIRHYYSFMTGETAV